MAPRRLCRRSLAVSDFHPPTLYSEPLHRVCPLHPRCRRPRGCRGRHPRMGGPLSTWRARLARSRGCLGSRLRAARRPSAKCSRGAAASKSLSALCNRASSTNVLGSRHPPTRRSGSPNRRPGSLAPRRPRRRPDRSTNCRAGGRGPLPPNGGSARSLYRRKQWSTGPPSGVAVTGPLQATIDQRE